MDNLIELTLNGFRAIGKAKIALNGITVVSGINGSGKSTLSRILYYIFKNANDFDHLVAVYLFNQIKPYINAFEQLVREFIYEDRFDKVFPVDSLRYLFTTRPFKSMEDAYKYKDIVAEVGQRMSHVVGKDDPIFKGVDLKRISAILKTTLELSEDKGIDYMIDALCDRIRRGVVEIGGMVSERPYSILDDSLVSSVGKDLRGNVVLKEYGTTIYGKDVTSVPLLHFIRKVVYIDTPMSVGLPVSFGLPAYWNDLNRLLHQSGDDVQPDVDFDIPDDILDGSVYYDRDLLSSGIKFKERSSGNVYNLTDCATGFKSFAALQLLLNIGYLDDTALMIIDEPEAHLHPQWIIEYARLIVLLHKQKGVKFFIATHSPDMVEALKLLSEKEKCLDSLCFYLAEENSDQQKMYDVKRLGHDIEPIFASFNKSYTKLDGYAGKE